jgi:hypothetical protein
MVSQQEKRKRTRAALHTTLVAGLIGYAGMAQAQGPSNAELQQEVEELRVIVKELKAKLDKKEEAHADARALHGAASKGASASGPAALDGAPKVASAPAATEQGAGNPQATNAGNSGNATGVPADGNTQYATKDDVDGLRASLENYKYDEQRLEQTTLASTTRNTVIGGTVQVRYTTQTPGTTTGTGSGSTDRNSSFDIPLAQLYLTGSLYRDYQEGRNLTYKLGFAYAPNVSSGSMISSSAPSGSQFNAQDVYLQYSFLPTTFGLETPILTATLGQQLIPFGLEAQTDESLRPVINSAQFVSGLGVGTRQIGLIVRGDAGISVDYAANYRAALLQYAFGIVNGSGPNQSDNNNHKDLLGRLAFTLPVDYASWLRQLTFGTSVYLGRKNLIDGTTAAGEGENNRYGFDIYYNHAPFGITAEYAMGRDGALGTKGGTTTVNSYGWYVTAFYTWGEQWVNSYKTQNKYDDWWPKSYQAFFRLDKWNPNTALSGNLTTIDTLGLNIFFAQTTKFQIDMQHTSSSRSAKASNALLAQFQFGF